MLGRHGSPDIIGLLIAMITIEDLPKGAPGNRGWPWSEDSLECRLADGLPKISVVTPSYNQAAFLEETIRSVLLQGYPNLEYVIMDGGSTDGSVEIIRKYEPFLAHWESRRDKGQTDAINRGMARCTGDIYAYLNSDDVYEPGALHAVARAFRQGDVDVLYGGFGETDERGCLKRRHAAPPFDIARLLLDNWIAQPSSFWSVDVRNELGGFDDRLQYSMDCDYWLRAFAAGFRFKPLDRSLSRFRLHLSSKTVAQPARFWEDYILSLQMLKDRESLPDSMRVMLPRAICRASWRAALNFAVAKDYEHAKSHIASAIMNVPQSIHDEELEIAFRACAMLDGKLVSPEDFRRRKQLLGLQRGALSRVWRKRLNREYNERFAKGPVSRWQLVHALLDDPRRILDWGFRRAMFFSFIKRMR